VQSTSRLAWRECAAEHAASREDMMSVQPLRKEGDLNPRSAEEAKALVKHVESLFMSPSGLLSIGKET
jgi:hypothetical protein